MDTTVTVGDGIILVMEDGQVREALALRVSAEDPDLKTTRPQLDCLHVNRLDAYQGESLITGSVHHRENVADPVGVIHWRLRTEHASAHERSAAEQAHA